MDIWKWILTIGATVSTIPIVLEIPIVPALNAMALASIVHYVTFTDILRPRNGA